MEATIMYIPFVCCGIFVGFAARVYKREWARRWKVEQSVRRLMEAGR